MTIPLVFISYAHESLEHRAAVKALADWLLEQGVRVNTDHPYEHRPPEVGWQHWMLNSIEDADVVLVVCTPRLKARYEKREDVRVGLGATYEGAIVTQTMYDAAQRNTKFFPVVPDNGDRRNIPLTLKPFDNGHCFPSGNERILRLIRDEIQLPTVARLFQQLPPGELRGANDSRLAPSEGAVYGREPEVARVLEFLLATEAGGIGCAHVTGVAGIGKTEVCKAALREWLRQSPEQRAFYIDVPDTAGDQELVHQIGLALGSEDVVGFNELRPRLREGLYYLDNVESVAEKPDGQQVLRHLRRTPGVKILASSRIHLPAALGPFIEIAGLPATSAARLFCDLWAGAHGLDHDDMLQRFVVDDLGCHALSITLTARLGQSYDFPALIRLWSAKGTAVAADQLMASPRDHSLVTSLGLTADSLRSREGALLLWTLGSLFPTGIDEAFLSAFEQRASLPSSTRQYLSRHHIWNLREGRFSMLPPVARYALDEATNERSGFSWQEASALAFDYFGSIAREADNTTSTDEVLNARFRLIECFGALSRLLRTECGQQAPRLDRLDVLNQLLRNQYRYCGAQAHELLQVLRLHLSRPAIALHQLGVLELRMGRLREARSLLEHCLELFNAESHAVGRAVVMKSLGDLENKLGRSVAARRLFEQALELFYETQDTLGQANTMLSLGMLDREMGRFEEGRRLLEQSLERYTIEQVGVGQADTLDALGDLELKLDNAEQSRHAYNRALELFRREGDRGREADIVHSLGNVERHLGNISTAKLLYEQALELCGSEFGLGQMDVLFSLSSLEEERGNVEEARRVIERAIESCQKIGSGLGQATSLMGLAELEERLGRLDEARSLYGRALDLFRREEHVAWQADTLRRLGELERSCDRPHEARRFLMRALELYALERLSSRQADVWMSIGLIDMGFDNFGEAAAGFKEAGKIYIAEKQPTKEVSAYLCEALCHWSLDDQYARNQVLVRAASVARGTGDESVERAVFDLLVQITGNEEAAQVWLREHGAGASDV